MAKSRFALPFLVVALIMAIGCSFTLSPVANTVDVGSVDLTKPLKKGKACETYFLFFIPVGGSASVVHAAKSANISHIQALDYERSSYIIIRNECVVVYGN